MRVDSERRRPTTAIDGLKVLGEAAPKTAGNLTALGETALANKHNQLAPIDRTCQFVLNRAADTEDLTVTSLTGPSITVPVRKMEHLSRVRTANFGITTMDSPFAVSGEPEQTLVIDKPHFVLCGLPVGSKEIDHHLYVNETRVGSYKTSAKALYQARRGPRSGKALSEPTCASPEKEVINYNTNLPESLEESGKKSVPPIPPTTPVNYAHHLASLKPKTAIGVRSSLENGKFHGSIPSTDPEPKYVPSDLLVKHRKMTLLRRDQSSDGLDLHREHSSVSMRSGKSIETVTESVVTNSLTITTGKGARLVTRALSKSANKVNYNNPYRNTKFRERIALSGHRRIEFSNLDSYLKYQKQQHYNGKHYMTPRAVLRIPKPCSDTFLLQMMYELNRPKQRKSPRESVNYSDVGMTKDLEEFVQTRTSSALSKTHSNIDKFLGKQSAKSAKSAKSIRSTIIDPQAIEEEEDWTDENIHVNSPEKLDNDK